MFCVLRCTIKNKTRNDVILKFREATVVENEEGTPGQKKCFNFRQYKVSSENNCVFIEL